MFFHAVLPCRHIFALGQSATPCSSGSEGFDLRLRIHEPQERNIEIPESPAARGEISASLKRREKYRHRRNDLGFDPVEAGPLSQAHTLEILASFWGAASTEPIEVTPVQLISGPSPPCLSV